MSGAAGSDESQSLAYRRDIDGLRAIAVLAVAFGHARLPGFSGGFVGVDIFFVISGYLITQILTRELRGGTFSVLRFYERRIRRIFPALFVVQLVTLAIGCVLLLPDDLVALARSAVATTFFSANFLFFGEAGYFEKGSWSKPLLHTWSLAVEEQFYILYPALLLFARQRLSGRYVAPILGIVLVSFVLCVVGTHNYAEANFYLAPMRAWELGLGCLLALGGERVALPRAARELAALAGAALIAYAVVHYDDDTHFPGVTALPPVVGAALILWAGVGGSSAIGRALSTGPAVFVGLISYSLYLWHWPLLVYARYLLLRAPTHLEASGILIVSAALAAASWRFVERPFRGSRSRIRTRPLFAAAAAVSVATVALGLAIAASDGLPQRADEKVLRFVKSRADRPSPEGRCGGGKRRPFKKELGDSGSAGASFVVWGDSFACMLSGEIGELGRREGRSGLLAWAGGCPPLLWDPEGEHDACAEANQNVLAAIVADPRLTDVVLVARWAYYFEGRPYGNEQLPAAWPRSLQIGEGAKRRAAAIESALDQTVARLVAAGRRVWVVGPIPEVGWDAPSVLARASMYGWTIDIDPLASDFFARQKTVFAALDRLGASAGVRVLHPHERLCGAKTCAVSSDGIALYSDFSHLSREGDERVAPVLAPIFQPAASGAGPASP